MKYRLSVLIVSLSALLFSTGSVLAHCEIPCGIYDDEMRMSLILEHAGTIEKSMTQINELEKGGNANQLVRWVTNKETHANEVQHIVTQYFLTQRIKFDAPDYAKKLAALHEMLVYAMKCKQTTDVTNVEMLRQSAEKFHKLYFHD
ncbi:MAG: superoxide dismutase, Ni [Desulfofustis sp.]|nr:superoxide dismutase, Ni [Desulfofustis sp.]NNF46435.1 superoxide dismutase [Desulfofustis sp.]NNK57236.1 superoxide dismutase [Desulfofustis sp.]RZW22681.1 MAG: superoxide dismutase [Desulfobulbaceae bacterium]